MSKPSKFVQFGCWNNLNNPDGCLRNVMNTLASHLQNAAKPPAFLIVSGDNYYPKKTVVDSIKRKFVIDDLLTEGFTLLPYTLPIYMLLGNHDLETNVEPDKSSLYIKSTGSPETDCHIIQKEFDSKYSNVHYKFFAIKKLAHDTLLLMIDTSVYTEDAADYLPCFNKFFEISSTERHFDTIDYLREHQDAQILSAIRNAIEIKQLKNIILVGHHPITGIKRKKAKDVLLDDIPYFKDTLQRIHGLFVSDLPNFYYLCSDLHMYQTGTVELSSILPNKMVIQQYIVGTGGAELDDDITSPSNTTFTDTSLTYTMKSNRRQCGFLECSIESPESVLFTFIPATIPGGRFSRKTKRRSKRRYKRRTRNYHRGIQPKRR